MALADGTRLGPYAVLSPLGAGGMGEVYRARDLRLDREVAIKVLPADVAADPEALRRFETEAKAVAALSHPNILAIFDVGESGGVAFAVTELLDGRTLRDAMEDAPLPLDVALSVAEQVAVGLAAAHEKGIVHRDVKPENVFLTRSGGVKLLDFGLARRVPPTRDGSGTDTPTDTPTVALLTRAGMVVGTPSYMSPEQARGASVDHRSDQFSLGAVLYETLSGERPFDRTTVVDTLAAVVRDEPAPLEERAPHVPEPVLWVVSRCLSKDVDGRYDSTRDLCRDLTACRRRLAAAPPAAPRPAPASPAPRTRQGRPRVAAAALLLAAGAGALGLLAGRALSPRTPLSFQKLTFRRGFVWSARFSPDGNTVVYSAAWDGGPLELFATRPDTPGDATPLEPRHAEVLAASPGELLVLADRPGSSPVLARVPLTGGTPRPVFPDVLAADASPSGPELAVVREKGGAWRVEYPVGRTIHESSGEVSHLRVSPSGRAVAFLDHPVASAFGAIVVLDGESGRPLLRHEAGAYVNGLDWSPSGEEVWYSSGRPGGDIVLAAVALSGRTRRLLAAPGHRVLLDVGDGGRILVAEGTRSLEIAGRLPGDAAERSYSWLDGTALAGLSADGRTLLFSELRGGGGALGAVFARELPAALPYRIAEGHALDLSPDGRWAAVVPRVPPRSITLVPTGVGEPRRLPRGTLHEIHSACFFPGGGRVLVLGAEKGRPPRLFSQDVAGGEPRALGPEGLVVAPFTRTVSPDGSTVAGISGAGGRRTPVLLPVGGGEARPVPGLLPDDEPFGWSPDGRWLYVREPALRQPSWIARVDVARGVKERWREMRPADGAGVVDTRGSAFVAGPEGSYLYDFERALEDLYLVSGLR